VWGSEKQTRKGGRVTVSARAKHARRTRQTKEGFWVEGGRHKLVPVNGYEWQGSHGKRVISTCRGIWLLWSLNVLEISRIALDSSLSFAISYQCVAGTVQQWRVIRIRNQDAARFADASNYCWWPREIEHPDGIHAL